MKRIALAILALSLLSACGENSSLNGFDINLFQIPAEDYTSSSTNEELFGLWESEEYEDNGVTQQIRWHVREDKTILSKKCTLPSGASFYVQVSIDFTEDYAAMSNISTNSMPLASQHKTTDVKLMTENRPCRISINPDNMAADSLVASDTADFELTENDFSDGEMDLHFAEENRTGKLLKISNRK